MPQTKRKPPPVSEVIVMFLSFYGAPNGEVFELPIEFYLSPPAASFLVGSILGGFEKFLS
jgi:hypothetical protein